MECPTCTHALANVGDRVRACPRCGTITGLTADGKPVVPSLVGRVKAFRERTRLSPAHEAQWADLKIDEAIYLPFEIL